MVDLVGIEPTTFPACRDAICVLVDLIGIEPTTFPASRDAICVLVDLVGIEPTTSSMPWKRLLNVLSTTYRPLGTAKRRGNTPKAGI